MMTTQRNMLNYLIEVELTMAKTVRTITPIIQKEFRTDLRKFMRHLSLFIDDWNYRIAQDQKEEESNND